MASPLKVGSVGLDYSGFRPNPTQLKRDGCEFIIRYSAGAGNSQSNTQWKLCGRSEIKEAVAAGLDFIANSEWYETRVCEGGRAGQQDGASDLAFWKSRGLAKGAFIYCSWDAAAVPASFAGVDAYLRAYNVALGGYYHVACYGGTPYLKHSIGNKIIPSGWRPNAGSWSSDGLPYQPPNHGRDYIPQAIRATPAALWQTGNYWYNNQADENLLIRQGVGSHLQALTVVTPPKPPQPTPVPPRPTPTPPVKEINMLIVKVDEAAWAKQFPGVPWPGIFLLDGNSVKHIVSSADLQAYSKAGIPGPVVISPAEFGSYPNVTKA